MLLIESRILDGHPNLVCFGNARTHYDSLAGVKFDQSMAVRLNHSKEVEEVRLLLEVLLDVYRCKSLVRKLQTDRPTTKDSWLVDYLSLEWPW